MYRQIQIINKFKTGHEKSLQSFFGRNLIKNIKICDIYKFNRSLSKKDYLLACELLSNPISQQIFSKKNTDEILKKFGNFSCLPKNHVKQLIQRPYLWNSYSSSVVRAIKDRTFIPSIRGVRYVEPSKMNFLGLIFHSLAIISVLRREFVIRSITYFLIYLFFNKFPNPILDIPINK